MAFFDRMSRLVRTTINEQLAKQQDPEKQLEQILAQLQTDLVDLRQTVAQAIAMQKRTDRQSHQANLQAEEWYRRAQVAVGKGNDELAHDALTKRRAYQTTADSMRAQVKEQGQLVILLKANLRSLEMKLIELRTKKDFFIARARSAEASIQLNELMDTTGTSTVLKAFDRMETQVMELEAMAELTTALNADQLEERFEALGEADEIDAELLALKQGIKSR
jgi:phage shock protein A